MRRNEEKKGQEMCIQLITPAKNPDTGECTNFPTPCDVPEGWKKVSNCESQEEENEGNNMNTNEENNSTITSKPV